LANKTYGGGGGGLSTKKILLEILDRFFERLGLVIKKDKYVIIKIISFKLKEN